MSTKALRCYYLWLYVTRYVICTPASVNTLCSTPVCGRIKEGRWVLKKIIPGVIKNNTQWFWCQTISIHQSFFILKQYKAIHFDCHYYTSTKFNIVPDRAVLVDTGYRSSAVQLIDRAVLVGRITLDNLVIVHDMLFIKSAPRRQSLPKASRMCFSVATGVLIILLYSHYTCLSLYPFHYSSYQDRYKSFRA